MFYKIGALKNFAKLKGKKTVLESLFNKVTYLRSAILLVKTPTQCFPANSVKPLRNLFIERLRWLLLTINFSEIHYIYKTFIRPYLDYGDVLYDLPNNECFSGKLEKIQYNAAIAITGAIKNTPRTKLNME